MQKPCEVSLNEYRVSGEAPPVHVRHAFSCVFHSYILGRLGWLRKAMEKYIDKCQRCDQNTEKVLRVHSYQQTMTLTSMALHGTVFVGRGVLENSTGGHMCISTVTFAMCEMQ